ncbi:hypothetical protein TNCV_4098341 [Trichonephila clavipes]|nr:hypothetical protein TNCV_4098341 [Trichonephila clavipes]
MLHCPATRRLLAMGLVILNHGKRRGRHLNWHLPMGGRFSSRQISLASLPHMAGLQHSSAQTHDMSTKSPLP